MRELTVQQKLFLQVLFEEANGSITEAKKLAGYADSTSTTSIVRSLKDEIADHTQMYIARNAPMAATSMVSAMRDPTQLGIKDKMSAAKDMMDRAGFAKTEKLEVKTTGGIMLLPPKQD
tara:strand:+ start:1509 stop:1865 length:357 start_codon:yes stop_codon:yes gene_type:complete